MGMFRYGQKQLVAMKAGIGLNYLSDILNRRKSPSFKTAKKISDALRVVTGEKIEWHHLINNIESDHRIFGAKNGKR